MTKRVSFLLLFLLLNYHRALLILLSLYTDVDIVEVLLLLLSVCRSYLGCHCRTLNLVHPNTPLKLLSLQVIQPSLRTREGNQEVEAVGAQHFIDFCEHLAGVGIGAFSALNREEITTTESNVPLSMTASKEFYANSIARTSICMYLKLGPLSL